MERMLFRATPDNVTKGEPVINDAVREGEQASEVTSRHVHLRDDVFKPVPLCQWRPCMRWSAEVLVQRPAVQAAWQGAPWDQSACPDERRRLEASTVIRWTAARVRHEQVIKDVRAGVHAPVRPTLPSSQQLSLSWPAFKSLHLLLLSDGEKEEGEESVDLRRTESDSVLKKVGMCVFHIGLFISFKTTHFFNTFLQVLLWWKRNVPNWSNGKRHGCYKQSGKSICKKEQDQRRY